MIPGERYFLFLLALLCLPFMILFLPVMLITRYLHPEQCVRIALTVSNRWPAYLQYVLLPYDLAILAAGARVVTVSPGDIDRIKDIMDNVDGVIISGGEDIEADENHKDLNSRNTNIQRDALEYAVIKEAVKQDLPLLCICRGMQLFTLVYGGRIASCDNNSDLCRTHISSLMRLKKHTIDIEHGTTLSDIFRNNKLLKRKRKSYNSSDDNGIVEEAPKMVIKVNSIHHHHVTDSGKLKISARSSDGIIEAVELESQTFAIGVQWHPELMALLDFKEKKIFKALVDAGKTRKKKG